MKYYPGSTCIVIEVQGTGLFRKRLLEMGFIPNTSIQILKVAPLGDPIELMLRYYILSIRKEQAAKIIVKEVSY